MTGGIKRRISSIGLGFCLVVASLTGLAQHAIQYFHTPTVNGTCDSVILHSIEDIDTLTHPVLRQVVDIEGEPLHYSREIVTSVCFDGKCRLLRVVVYWNVTGRYLGFALPDDEFLSKTEHEPFVPSEYDKLHEILQDPHSPLGEIAFSELVPSPVSGGLSVDAVSSATARHLSDQIVPGAAFTTYTLWHIVYGPTAKEVSALTALALSENLWLRILDSPVASDKAWALEYRDRVEHSSPAIRDALLALCLSSDYFLADRSLRAITGEDLSHSPFQLALVQHLPSIDYGLRKLVLTTLRKGRQLDDAVVKRLASMLADLNGDLLLEVFRLFDEKGVDDVEVFRSVADLLVRDNSFIARQAYSFLKKKEVSDKTVQRKISRFESKNDLD